MTRYPSAVLVTFVAGAVGAWLLWTEGFITDDSYFYLVIARNIVTKGSQTFSDVLPTNGFHPAWCYALTLYDFILSWIDVGLLKRAVAAVPLAGLVLSLGCYQAFRFARNIGAVELLMLCIPLAFLTHMGVLFSEAHMSFLGLAWLCARVTRSDVYSNSDSFIIGLAAGICFLSRLDSAFTVGLILGWWFLRCRSWRQGTVAAAAFAVIVAPYLIANAAYFGGITPVSGWMKSTFPHPLFKGFRVHGFASSLCGYTIAFGIVPMTLGWLMAAVLRPALSSRASMVYPLGIGVLIHFAYIALFTLGATDPYWYYVQPIFFLGAATGLAGARVARLRGALSGVGTAVLAASIALSVMTRPALASQPRHWVALALDYLQRNQIHDSTLIVSDCPGKLAFNSDNRVFAVDMLTATRPFYQSMSTSGNALRYIVDTCRGMGKPVTHVLYLGSEWLVPTDADSAVVYHDPRSPTRHEFGRLGVTDGLKLVHKARAMRIWSLMPSP